MKVSAKEWQEICRKAGITDPAIIANEQDRKKKADLEILMNVWQVQDRQWLRDHREALKAEQDRKKAIAKQEGQRKQLSKQSSFLNGLFDIAPAMPLRFDADKPFRVPEKLIRIGRDLQDRFRWIE